MQKPLGTSSAMNCLGRSEGGFCNASAWGKNRRIHVGGNPYTSTTTLHSQPFGPPLRAAGGGRKKRWQEVGRRSRQRSRSRGHAHAHTHSQTGGERGSFSLGTVRRELSSSAFAICPCVCVCGRPPPPPGCIPSTVGEFFHAKCCWISLSLLASELLLRTTASLLHPLGEMQICS